jgi:hypothetical protein
MTRKRTRFRFSFPESKHGDFVDVDDASPFDEAVSDSLSRAERFLYEYDFGDLWQHQIRFEGGVAPGFSRSPIDLACCLDPSPMKGTNI